MNNFSGRGIENKNTSNKDNYTMHIEAASDKTAYIDFKYRILEILNNIDEDKEKYDTEYDSNTYPPAPNHGLLIEWCSLGF